MDDVQFDLGDQDYGKSVTRETKTPAIVALLVKYRIAKDTKTANYILLGFVVIAFIVTLVVIF
jgi:hypothetical protein